MEHVRSSEGFDVKVPSNGQVNLNSVLGALGTAGFLGINANNLIGGLAGNRNGASCCHEDHLVNRYELSMQQALAAKDSEIALLKSNTYQDQKSLELYRYIDAQLNTINNRLAAQDVRNQGVADAIREVSKEIDYKVNLEAERRCCSDQRIVAYLNGTFAPKVIVGFTPDATNTTASPTYNPLCCECGK